MTILRWRARIDPAIDVRGGWRPLLPAWLKSAGRALLAAWRSMLRRARVLVSYLLALSGAGLVIAGVAAIYPPAGLIVAGIALLGVLTFDPSRAGRLTWPR